MSMEINKNKCTGCGNCIDVCPQQAITLRNNLAVIDQNLCVECGRCAALCPAGAIRSTGPAFKESAKAGERAFYGYGRGFGFRGSSPSRPYVGRGRGGSPHWRRPGLYGGADAYPAPGRISYPPSPATKNKLSYLKSKADMMKQEMAEIERRIREFERGNIRPRSKL